MSRKIFYAFFFPATAQYQTSFQRESHKVHSQETQVRALAITNWPWEDKTDKEQYLSGTCFLSCTMRVMPILSTIEEGSEDSMK